MIIICSTELKAKSADPTKCIANSIPVIIWATKHSPNNDPKFHKYEIVVGSGLSTK
jgi:hypothetical protein